jgi:CBS domain-containing protein
MLSGSENVRSSGQTGSGERVIKAALLTRTDHASVMNLMTHQRVRHLPVVLGGKLAGIVSIGDVVKYRLEELELETNVLRDAYSISR